MLPEAHTAFGTADAHGKWTDHSLLPEINMFQGPSTVHIKRLD